MLAKLRQIQIKPATFDEEGFVSKPEYASLNFTVELDSNESRKEILALFEVLRKEYINIEVEKTQGTLPDA